MDPKENNIDLNLSPEVAEGEYANLAVISHSSSEFVFDFIRMLPGLPKPEVKSRIVMAPEHTKRLMLALQENIRKYEAIFGEIKLNQVPQPEMPQGFTGPIGDA